MDLTAYVEKHEFCFDAVLDEHVSNDEVTFIYYFFHFRALLRKECLMSFNSFVESLFELMCMISEIGL